MRFFTPNVDFFKWVSELLSEDRNRAIVDVGCGEGELVLDLMDRGVSVVGIEQNQDKVSEAYRSFANRPEGKAFPHILCGDVFDLFKVLPKKSIFLFCRPCHSDWIQKFAKIASGARCFYVGLDKNVNDDLHTLDRRKIASNVGEANESIWEFRPSLHDIPRHWCLVEREDGEVHWLTDGPRFDPGRKSEALSEFFWWKDDSPSRFSKSDSDTILEEVWQDYVPRYGNPDWVDRRKTSEWKLLHQEVTCSSSRFGWIDLEGNFFRCEEYEHHKLAYDYFFKTIQEVEESGFIKIACHAGEPVVVIPLLYYGDKARITWQQARTLSELRSKGEVHFDDWVIEDAERPPSGV